MNAHFKKLVLSQCMAAPLIAAFSILQISAQSGGKGSGGGANAGAYRGGDGSVTRLLWKPTVQAELKLDESQRNAIEGATQRLAALENTMRRRVNVGPHQAGSISLPALINQSNQELDSVVPKVLHLLTESQRKRLQEIRLQVLDSQALLLPEVAQALGLSQRQQREILNRRSEAIRSSFAAVHQDRTAAREQFRRSRRGQARTGSGSFRGGGISSNTPEEARQNLHRQQQFIKAADQRILAEVLTPQQQATFQAMKGLPFEVE